MFAWILVAILAAAVTYLGFNDIKITNNKYVILSDKPKIENKQIKPWYKIAVGLFCVVLIICIGIIYKNYKTKPVEPQKIERINVNKATEKQLKGLPNIGDVRTKNIIKNRPIKSEEQLKKVLGKKTYESIKDKIKIGE